MVFLVGSAQTLSSIPLHSLLFLILSGLATGASWICYFKALSLGDVNKVVPIDKSSTVLSVLLAIICLGEREHLIFRLAATLLLAKIGITGVESNLGTAIRTGVVLLMAWMIVFFKGKMPLLTGICKKELSYILLSGLSTGASWLCYYYAIQNGIVSIVVPIDKLSILVTVTLSYLVFKEKLSKKAVFGLMLMTAGTLLMTLLS